MQMRLVCEMHGTGYDSVTGTRNLGSSIVAQCVYGRLSAKSGRLHYLSVLEMRMIDDM